MRLIDADALMESIGCADAVKYGNRGRAQQDTSYSTMMLYEIRNEIDAQPTVGGWISVKDKLPEENSLVIVYDEGSKKVWSSRYLGATFYEEDNSPYFTYRVNWWMPLPEPPEEAKE